MSWNLWKELFRSRLSGLFEKLRQLYERGLGKGVSNPESYAVKNWIVSAQGFLINCATFGFTSNYDRIMEGAFCCDLFHGTYGEKLMDLLGIWRTVMYFPQWQSIRWRFRNLLSSMI